jgi:predicted aspartyl protease
MQKLFLILFSASTLCSMKSDAPKDQFKELRIAYRTHNYFRLDNLIRNTNPAIQSSELMLFKAKTFFVFNKPFESDSLISILLQKYSQAFDDTVVADLFYMRAVNEDRLENYKKSYKYGSVVVKNYSHLYDSTFITELNDDNDIRLLLSNSPKMDLTRSDDTQIRIKRDIAGLINVPVFLGPDSMDFVFDTGAGMPVIVNSLAQKYGFLPLGKKVKIVAVTGKRIDADIALVNLKIGNISIRNSPFIVFPDSVLSFGKGAYVIKGVIGFPIIRKLGEIIFKNDKDLFIPKEPERIEAKNFALDDATPVILVVYKNDSLPFHFDTGADKTFLYTSFLNKYKDEIVKSSKKKNNLMGGAGGTIKIESYVLDSLQLSAGNVQTRLDSVSILTKSLNSLQNEYFYGNFGQDFIKKYNEMKLNFTYMNISFSK